MRCEFDDPLDRRIGLCLDLTLRLSLRGLYVRRVEIINGIGGRRRWSVDDKARIVEETLVAGRGGVGDRPASRADAAAVVRLASRCPAIGRGRRRRRSAAVRAGGGGAAEAGRRFGKQRKPRRAGRVGGATGIIEMEIGGVTVRVGRGAEAKTVAAVIRALKAGA